MLITDQPIWSLGIYKLRPFAQQSGGPSGNDYWSSPEIERFSTWVKRCQDTNSKYSSDVRGPEHPSSILYAAKTDNYQGIQHSWHQDAADFDGKTPYIVLWSNTVGTEIQDIETGTFYQGAPGEVVALDNMRFKHRTPRLDVATAKNRWFARSRIPRWAYLKDHPDIKPLAPLARLGG